MNAFGMTYNIIILYHHHYHHIRYDLPWRDDHRHTCCSCLSKVKQMMIINAADDDDDDDSHGQQVHDGDPGL